MATTYAMLNDFEGCCSVRRQLGPGAVPARQKTAVGPPQRLEPTLAGTAGETAARAPAPVRRNRLGSQSIGCHPEKDLRRSRRNGGEDGKARSVPRYAARQKSRSGPRGVGGRQRSSVKSPLPSGTIGRRVLSYFDRRWRQSAPAG